MATKQINAEQAKVIAALSTARQKAKDAKQAEEQAKATIESWGTSIGDVLMLGDVTVAKIVEGTRTDLDKSIVARRAPGAYRQALKTSRFRKVTIA